MADWVFLGLIVVTVLFTSALYQFVLRGLTVSHLNSRLLGPNMGHSGIDCGAVEQDKRIRGACYSASFHVSSRYERSYAQGRF